jgi:hypothetical protein
MYYTLQPPDYSPVTGADISTVRDASDGTLYWSCQVAVPQQAPQQAVYHWINNVSTRHPIEKTVTGRGQLVVLNGQLWLNAWNESESPRKGYLILIPECVSPEPMNGAQGPPGPQGPAGTGGSGLTDEQAATLAWAADLRAASIDLQGVLQGG